MYMKTGFIYEWTNNLNGTKYMGSHLGKETDNYKGSGLRFRNAVKKYGIENFTRKILDRNIPEHLLLEREQYFLDLYKCSTSDEYYNIAEQAGGGRIGADYKKASKRMKEHNPNADGKARKEYIKKYGAPKGWNFTSEKIRVSQLGKNNSNANGNARKTKTYLVCEKTKNIEVFNSLKEAEESKKANHRTVYLHRKNNTPTKGYYWYVGEQELEKKL